MKRVVAMLSVMAVMVVMLAMPAVAAPRYVGFYIVCPNETPTTIEADPQEINKLFPGYFGDLNKKLAQQYQACEVTRYTTPAPPPS
jgi:hypothetical protein